MGKVEESEKACAEAKHGESYEKKMAEPRRPRLRIKRSLTNSLPESSSLAFPPDPDRVVVATATSLKAKSLSSTLRKSRRGDDHKVLKPWSFYTGIDRSTSRSICPSAHEQQTQNLSELSLG